MTTGVFSGPRAKVGLVNPSTGVAKYFGIFESCSWGQTYDIQPTYILGRWTAASLDYTAVEPVQVTCSGWRVVGHGPHTDGQLPFIQNLLTADYLQIVVTDRKTGATVATIVDVRPSGYSTGVAARQLSQLTVSYMGIRAETEEGENTESAGSTFLP